MKDIDRERIVNERVNDLIKNANSYANKGRVTFTGPSKYFYSRVISCHQKEPLEKLLENTQFYEYVYATLTSWGMHRMGPEGTGAKMKDFHEFEKSICSCKNELLKLKGKTLEKLSQDQIDPTKKVLRSIFNKLDIMKSGSKIVGVSKTLHFILPELIVPIDRTYTLEFFNKHLYTNKRDKEVDIFVELFGTFVDISQKLKHKFKKEDFQPYVTKFIDNAIVGWPWPPKKKKKVSKSK